MFSINNLPWHPCKPFSPLQYIFDIKAALPLTGELDLYKHHIVLARSASSRNLVLYMILAYWWMLFLLHIDGLLQERRTSCVLALELRLSCINPSISCLNVDFQPWCVLSNDLPYSAKSNVKFRRQTDISLASGPIMRSPQFHLSNSEKMR